MYHNILVPVAYEPGFDTSRELETAAALQAAGGRVTLLHVMDPVPFYAINYMPEGWREELVAELVLRVEQYETWSELCCEKQGFSLEDIHRTLDRLKVRY